jgi:hypothetical protein
MLKLRRAGLPTGQLNPSAGEQGPKLKAENITQNAGVSHEEHGVDLKISQVVEKVIILRLLKNAPACAEASAGRQTQVESAKSRLRGLPKS